MKYFVVALISAVFFIGVCQAATPSKKCRDDYKARTLSESCILHCEYKAYGFANDKYDIKRKQIDQFVNVLVNGNSVTSDKRKKLENLLRGCANTARDKNPKLGCRTTVDYYRCIVADKNLINYSKFVAAIIAHDKTININ
uniref:13.7 kDa salivary protein n=1 Tax=Phlebotomus duboscqi TaxID=37738 RepID=Q06K74_PHLDU|nr:13.7 kDa salivary protein [Phlebotomus duboscqi]